MKDVHSGIGEMQPNKCVSHATVIHQEALKMPRWGVTGTMANVHVCRTSLAPAVTSANQAISTLHQEEDVNHVNATQLAHWVIHATRSTGNVSVSRNAVGGNVTSVEDYFSVIHTRRMDVNLAHVIALGRPVIFAMLNLGIVHVGLG